MNYSCEPRDLRNYCYYFFFTHAGFPTVRRGDRIRCTVMFEQKKSIRGGQNEVPVCFTLNGRKIIIQDSEEDERIVYPQFLYPCISMTDGYSVLAKVSFYVPDPFLSCSFFMYALLTTYAQNVQKIK